MITARNIAASAERGMIELGKIFHKADPKHKDIQTCKALASVISKATHFVIPDGGRILNDSKRGIVGRQLCLPYPLITVEYMKKLGVDNRDTKCLLVADQPTEDDNITLWGCFKYPDSIWTHHYFILL